MIQVVQFVKVLSQSQLDYLDSIMRSLKAMLVKSSETIEKDIPSARREVLVAHLMDLHKNSPNASEIRYILSSSMEVLSSTTSGARIIQGASYKGMKASQAIMATTIKMLEDPKKCDLDLCSIGGMLAVCGNLVRHPGFFLTDGCSAVVRLLSAVLESEELENAHIKDGLDEFVKSLLITSLGSTLLNVGTVAVAYKNYLLENAGIYKKMDYYSAHKVGQNLSQKLFLEAQNLLWNVELDSGYAEGKLQADDTCSAIVCLLSSRRRCEVLLEGNAENSTQDLWNAVVMLPSGYVASEDDIILSLSVLKGLICCLKTCIFLETKYSVKKNLHEVLSDYRTDDGNIILTEVTEIVQQILERIQLTGNLHQRMISSAHTLLEKFPEVITISEVSSQPPVHDIPLSITKPYKINLRCTSHCKHLLEDFLNANVTLPATDFASFLGFGDDREQQVLNDKLGTTTNTNKCGIEMTVQCGRQLGLLDQEDTQCFSILHVLIKNNSSVYGASCCSGSYDFLLATIFLLLRGDEYRTLELHKFLCDRDCYYFYFHEMYSMCDTMLCAALSHVFEAMLVDHLPSIYYALQMSRYQPRWVLNHWIGQMFWNVLDFDEISTLLMTSIVFGGDYIIYVCISILKHIEYDILEHFNSGCLVMSLRAYVVQQFRVSSYLGFMHSLRQQYHETILKCFVMYAH